MADYLSALDGPPLPTGRRLHLPGRGVTFYREVEGPPGAPTLVLCHGWLASGGLNWFRAFEPLGEHFRVIAPDIRGHGRGIRSRRHFRLSDCADDTAALCDTLGIDQAIAVGYSMGGPISQLLWKRHPGLVEGLVQGATFDTIAFGSNSRLVFGTMMTAAAGTSTSIAGLTHLPTQVADRVRGRRRRYATPSTLRDWALSEMARHDKTAVAQAGVAMSAYSSRRWLWEVDVPTSVVVTTKDRAVQPATQMRLADSIEGATVHRWDAGHASCARSDFGQVLLGACLDVAARCGHDVPRLRATG